ncbi:endothelin-converting enzyme homolog isoform X3 [Ostrea edulis]|uniref:endothelin-converting enzyme homolog isoform X2 n=1 Tax=Ostrea edulis TaxID=37623 RepID=UPI0020959833|nr:endothelin-converting enzyme homolog isoform X2 [Ostrea edulis]XP_048752654.1 endothelin-converting enzyme homolog isoform X3 [Ostrea edulis]
MMSNKGYKHTHLEEDEASENSVPGALDFETGVVVRNNLFSWQRKTLLERVLIVLCLLLMLTVLIMAIVMATQSSSNQTDTQTSKLQKIQICKECGKIIPVIKTNYTKKCPTPSAVTPGPAPTCPGPPSVCLTPACVTVAASLYNSMDTTADPCEDFYQYACGGWVDSHPLPSGHSRWGTFNVLWQENQIVMKKVIEKPLNKTASLAEVKAQKYYESCMDRNKTIEKLGGQPLQKLLSGIGAWPKLNETTHLDIQDYVEKIKAYGINILFAIWVGVDDRNSSVNILQVDQGGLGLPERQYYLNESDKKVLNAYLEYMTKVGVLMGGEENVTRKHMQDVIALETELANITVPSEDRRDEEKIYHKITVTDLQGIAPFLNWTKFFGKMMAVTNITLATDEPIVSFSSDFLRKMSAIVTTKLQTEQGRRTLQNYLLWHIVSSLTSYLSKPFRNAKKILTEALSGTTGGEELWRYCITDTDGVVGMALGAMFVREAFQGESKQKAEKMVNEVKYAFKKNLPNLLWMDDETRQAAKEKANAVIDLIGFPSYINNNTQLNKEYQALEVKGDEYFQNNIRNMLFVVRKDLQTLRSKPKKNQWDMTPPTVNAYYTPTKNEIVFPAGILQAPFYEIDYPKSLNFGAMGVVMGHELTHGFDDQGREYDKYGNLHSWWNNQSIVNFQNRTQCIVDQYSQYKLGNNYVKGKQTLGENIADNGGLKAAYHAFEYWLKQNAEEQPLPALNLTHKQLFFLGFAQVWCSTSTAEADHLQILTDPHSPAIYRVIGTLSNSKEFAEQYNCPVNSKMNPQKKCEVW